MGARRPQSLYFISDRDGIPNIYRVARRAATSTQVTDVATGMSGITASSPALSVASRSRTSRRSASTTDGDYDIYVARRRRAAAPVRQRDDRRRRADAARVLPPLERTAERGRRRCSTTRPSACPPRAATYEVEPTTRRSCRSKALGQPTIAVGADRFGAASAAASAFCFGDMLGDQNLATAVQINSGARAAASAQEHGGAGRCTSTRRNRWNWGLVGGQVPYLSGGVPASTSARSAASRSTIDETIIFRQTEQSAAGVVAYPFNRAQRVEFQGGVSRSRSTRSSRRRPTRCGPAQLLCDDTQETSLADAADPGDASAALVFDTSNFGATSPVQGQRYRLEAAPTFGDLNFTSLLADYRRYFMPAPFYTLADARACTTGATAAAARTAGSSRCTSAIRISCAATTSNTFEADECVPTRPVSAPPSIGWWAAACWSATSSSGSRCCGRSALAGMYGPVPVEVAFFADGGVAWNRGDDAGSSSAVRSTGRRRSAGVAFRVNLLGFAVGEFDFAHPFQRPGRGLGVPVQSVAGVLTLRLAQELGIRNLESIGMRTISRSARLAQFQILLPDSAHPVVSFHPD